MALPAPVAPLSMFSVFASRKPVATALLLRVRLFTNVVWIRLVVWMGLVVSGVALLAFGGVTSGPFATATLLLSVRPFVNVVWMVLAAPVVLVVLLLYW